MSSSHRKGLSRNTVAVDVSCGCRRPKLSDIFSPRTKSKASAYHKSDLYGSSSSSWDRGGFSVDEDDTTTTFSPNMDTSPTHSEEEEYDLKNSKMVTGFGRIGESVAVVKDSNDPYLDFRRSMLQMILENEIYAREDLRDLLDCFLQLNSPYHHEIIVRAFTEIWNGFLAVRAGASAMKPVARRMSREF
ncbi:PREDICTED: transcription repressor OFP6-like [Nelumbo nucifera]|uniref:Transcription repressor n=2 Tax=Nelumbo nucifera TaxID=4432 RepID=A0A1U7ZG26_NELNU|nr:PREDICTED: transcription repressor OFP6-like [Nelumbo nucifera]DAD48429.1 TPA_asm: hypothetical protein HUJ06_018366 [Nelumbo nucifera]